MHSPIHDFLYNSSVIPLSQEKLKDIKDKDPNVALMKFISSQGISIKKPPSSSTGLGSEPFGNTLAMLIQQLKMKIVEVDLF